MASTLSIDLASSQLPRGLTWSCSTVQKLVRAASYRCRSKSSHHLTAPTPKHTSPRRSRSYGPGDAYGWGMVPVLNELLDVTASQQHRRRHSTQSPSSDTSRSNDDDNDHSQRPAPARKAVCLHCRRKLSPAHDAASRPQHGFCSIDCRANHDYMSAIGAELGRDGFEALKATFSSTLESTYSPVDPVSHLTYHEC